MLDSSRRWIAIALAFALAFSLSIVVEVSGSQMAASAEPGASRFTPLTPTRILDTRIGLGARVGKLADSQKIELLVWGSAGVPVNATAIAMNVTVDNTSAPGFVSVEPSNNDSGTSTVNFTRVGQTIANFAIVPLNLNGMIDLKMRGGGHVIGDVLGYFTASGSTSEGRYRAVSPTRLLDTRLGAPVAADGRVDLPVAGIGDVPTDAVAVAVNVTAVGAKNPGFVTVWPTGVALPVASTLNMTAVGDIPNLTIVPLGSGSLSLFTSATTHLLVDVQGYITGPGSDQSDDGLFVPLLIPRRVMDTRLDGDATRLVSRFDQEFSLAGRPGYPAETASAVAANITITSPRSSGFLTVYPSRTARPNSSNLNYRNGETVAGFGLPRLGDGQTLAFMSYQQADVIVDVTGYFTGSPSAPVAPPPVSCANFMTYFHDPDGFPDGDRQRTLMGADLAGGRPDWVIDTQALTNRVAPDCQSIIVTRLSKKFANSLALYRLDSPLEADLPGELLVDGVGWRGGAFSADGTWFTFFDGQTSANGLTYDLLSAINVETKAIRPVTAEEGTLHFIGGVDRDARPRVTMTLFNGDGPYYGGCNFRVALRFNEACGVSAERMDEFDYHDKGTTVDRVSVYDGQLSVFLDETPGTPEPRELVATSAYHPRLTFNGDVVASIDGQGVFLWHRDDVQPDTSHTPTTQLLNGTTDDFPQFSKKRLRMAAAPPIWDGCQFNTYVGCAPSRTPFA